MVKLVTRNKKINLNPMHSNHLLNVEAYLIIDLHKKEFERTRLFFKNFIRLIVRNKNSFYFSLDFLPIFRNIFKRYTTLFQSNVTVTPRCLGITVIFCTYPPALAFSPPSPNVTCCINLVMIVFNSNRAKS